VPIEIYTLRTDVADAWVAWDGAQSHDYAYGGCRMTHWRTRYEDAIGILCALMRIESSYKNTLINQAVEAGALDDLRGQLPPGFVDSRVGGARCVLRPASPAAAMVMRNPDHPEFRDTMRRVFEPLGELLNDLGGRVKLTPDFGKFAGMADLLREYTPHVLGVSRELGGCGGKSTYSATGVIAGYEALATAGYVRRPDMTLIGSAGAMGATVLDHLMAQPNGDVTVCDLKYDDGAEQAPAEVRRLESVPGRFTDEALSQPGTVTATTWGGELERSNHEVLQPDTVLLLAHNLSIPTGIEGIELMRQVCRPDVVVIPGQVLTLGGALTSRLEWFSRQARIEAFNKPLAHQVVRQVVSYWVVELARSMAEQRNPYEALLDACEQAA
jgi:glutamate dehydrogenase/leucine dehydrogenase